MSNLEDTSQGGKNVESQSENKGADSPFSIVSFLKELLTPKQLNVLYGMLGILVLWIAYKWYQTNVVLSEVDEARQEIRQSIAYWETDSFLLAVEGDGNNLGFVDIAENYGNTAVGNAACYYAGIGYLKLKEYDMAISYLEQFSSDDPLLSALALGGIGDAYSDMENYEMALDYYLEGIEVGDNRLTDVHLMQKAAVLYEQMGKYQEAKMLLEQMTDKYGTAAVGGDVSKRVARLETFLGTE